MKLALVAILFWGAAVSGMQAKACDSGTLWVYNTTYAARDGAWAIMYAISSPTGADSEYALLTLEQVNYLNNQQFGTSLIDQSTSVGDAVGTYSQTDINVQGWGTYMARSLTDTYDTCNGMSYPPYVEGNVDGLFEAAFTVDQPAVANPGNLYIATMTGTNGTENWTYPSSVTLAPGLTYGITGTPQWAISGPDASEVSVSCTSCETPVLTVNPGATGACSVALTASFTLDGLQSNSLGLMVLAPTQVSANDPNTGLHADHNAVSGGYASLWFYQIVDSCGNPMQFVNMHEAFPNGFTYDYSGANWIFPTPNSWSAGNTGLWDDTIGEHGATTPPSLAPQNPLGSVLIFYGLQNIFVNPVQVTTDSQAHFQDHGGYN